MSIFNLLLKPKKSIAAAVDAVIDRLNDKYRIEGEIRFVDGGVQFYVDIVDKRPEDTALLDELDKEKK